MSWYTEEEIEKLLEDEELRKRIARFVTMSGEEFFDEVYTGRTGRISGGKPQ